MQEEGQPKVETNNLGNCLEYTFPSDINSSQVYHLPLAGARLQPDEPILSPLEQMMVSETVLRGEDEPLFNTVKLFADYCMSESHELGWRDLEIMFVTWARFVEWIERRHPHRFGFVERIDFRMMVWVTQSLSNDEGDILQIYSKKNMFWRRTVGELIYHMLDEYVRWYGEESSPIKGSKALDDGWPLPEPKVEPIFVPENQIPHLPAGQIPDMFAGEHNAFVVSDDIIKVSETPSVVLIGGTQTVRDAIDGDYEPPLNLSMD
jgi:hypothetical protein